MGISTSLSFVVSLFTRSLSVRRKEDCKLVLLSVSFELKEEVEIVNYLFVSLSLSLSLFLLLLMAM